MKKYFILALSLIVVFASCTRKEPGITLEKDTPAYLLAAGVAAKIAYLDPESNNALISTKYFDIRSGDVFNAIQTNFGNRAKQLATFDEARIKSIVNQHALQLAEIKLLLKAAERANITITDAEVDSTILARYIRNGDREKFMTWLEENNIKFETVQNDTRNGLTIQKYIDETLAKEFTVTEEELQELYNEDKSATVRHILLKTQGMADSTKQEVYKKMESILERAKAGEDFAVLANEFSEDPGSSKNGGLYKDFPKGQMVKPFEDASFSVPVGEISDIVETTYGYHIIKVIERNKEKRPFDEVKSGYEAKLKSEKSNDAYNNLIEKLKSKSKFKIIEY